MPFEIPQPDLRTILYLLHCEYARLLRINWTDPDEDARADAMNDGALVFLTLESMQKQAEAEYGAAWTKAEMERCERRCPLPKESEKIEG